MELELKNLIEQGNATIAALRTEVEGLKSADVVATEKVARIEADLAKNLSEKSALEARLNAMETAAARPGAFGAKADDAALELKTAFVDYLRKPNDYGKKSAYEGLLQKQVNVTNGSDGALGVPQMIAADVARIAKDFSPMRSLARVITVGTSDYKEILSLGGAAFEWVGDTATRNVTATPTIKDVKPTFGEIAARAPATSQSLEDIFFDVASWLSLELAETFTQAEGAAFISGDGNVKPTGLLNGTAVTGINSGNAATLGTNPFDKLVDMVYSIKGDYRSDAAFLMNSGTLAQLVKVKDSQGNYIYQPSLVAGVASTILGYRVATDENMPAVAANAKPIVFGSFSRGYLIADRIGLHMLVNPYKISGVVEFEARKRVGGIVKDANALKALVIAV